MTEQELNALLQQADDLYLQGQLDKAIEILRRIKREDSPKLYAKAQFNLGVILGEQGDTEGAIAAYRNIIREDSSELYATAQVNLGIVLGKQGDSAGAIVAYRNIERVDSSEQYAKSQLNLGVFLQKQGKIKGAIAAFRSIERTDSPELYARARIYLGITLGAQGDSAGAIAAYRSIEHTDSPDLYAEARFNLGVTLQEQDKIEDAIAAYRSIERTDSPEQYAKAQVNLGIALGAQGDSAGEIAAYRSIERTDSPEQYAKAQFNLGFILEAQDDSAGAIAAYRSIDRTDSLDLYAKAQFNLGVLLQKQGKIEEAIAVFRSIKRKDSKEAYANAQFNLGVALGAQGNSAGEIAVYRSIKRTDSPGQYAKARFNLGVVLQRQGKIKEAIAAYCSIERTDLPVLYVNAQWNLGILWFDKNKTKSQQAFVNSRPIFYYQSESLLKILNCPPGSRSNLRAVYDATVSIIKTLFISSGGGIAGENPLKVAHYTRPSIARVLIAGEEDKASSLRLNTVKNTNDPTEGKVLYGYLHKSCTLPSGVLDAEQESDSQALAAFISCFTFNHDSLNQFRLYGKEDGLEASGVSLVFGKSFFSAADPFAIMTVAPEQEDFTANNTIEDSRPGQPDKTTQKKLDKLPLYRCIYLDPQSGYVSIAHRDKVTFYAEAWYGKKTAAHQDICKEAERRWKEYQTEIDRLTEKVKDDLSTLTKTIKAVAKDAENDVLQTLVFILQPLRYLVKHAAFQEEQECRMLYIGNLLEEERIYTDWDGKQMYLEYAAPVRNSLDKIYLSPGAEPYADFFKRELPTLAKQGGIRRSKNPFRNK